jgi:putative membrane protein
LVPFFIVFIFKIFRMNFIIKLFISSIVVFSLSYFLPGVHVTSIVAALWVAIVLGLLNTFLKPVLVFLTIPVTLFTLGLFLLVINAMIVLICDYFIPEFQVDGFITALLFSVLLSVSQSILNKIFVSEK